MCFKHQNHIQDLNMIFNLPFWKHSGILFFFFLSLQSLYVALIGGLSLTAAFVYFSEEFKGIPGQGKHQMSYMGLSFPIFLKAHSLSGCRIAKKLSLSDKKHVLNLN